MFQVCHCFPFILLFNSQVYQIGRPFLIYAGFPEPFNITAKDGVKLDSIFVRQSDATHTVVVWGGMPGGREGQMHMATFLRGQAKVNTLLVSRRGQSYSQGSSIRTGELGIFLDTQASLSYLVKNQSIPLNRIIVYGYCLGGSYATIAVF